MGNRVSADKAGTNKLKTDKVLLSETKVRPKMPRQERAKQFMPFSALKGYKEALRSKEKVVVSKADLSDEYKEELDRKLRLIQKNDIVTVVYYNKNEYIKISGMVSRIDKTSRILKIVNTKISFDDLYDISRIQNQ